MIIIDCVNGKYNSDLILSYYYYFMDFTNVQHITEGIKTITIQGATKIAKEACKVMEQELRNQKFDNQEDLIEFFDKSSQMLIDARETEPLLRNGMKYVKFKLKNGASQIELADAFAEYLQRIENEEDIRTNLGADLIYPDENIMTHCHSSSVVKILTTAHQQGKNIHVYNTETRPLFQGRKTSTNLTNAGVPNTMITDSSAPFFVDNIYEDDIDIHKVFLGADCIKTNGDTINKVGSFSIGLSAWHSGIPVYIVGSLLKIDPTNQIDIETRDGSELWEDAPKGLKILNYAFDMVPAKFITGIITEFGIIRPENILKELEERYPRMLDDL